MFVPGTRTADQGAVDVSADGHLAWSELVAGNAGEVWSAALAAGLSPEDAAEVSQLTWLRLASDLDRIVANGTDVRGYLLDAVARETQVVSTRVSLGWEGRRPG